MPDLNEITSEWLSAHGYDGLCNCGTDCGCLLDNLMPCCEPGFACEAGYKVEPPEGEDAEFWVSPRKPEKEADDAKAP